MSEVQSTFRLIVGNPVPVFELPDARGAIHGLHDVAGKNGLLVVFACNHCPFVVHLASALGDFAREIAAQGVGCVAINPNDTTRYPEDAPSLMPEFAEKSGWDFPYLVDESQDTALSYGAACTPDFFLVDALGKLFYAGQFDDSRPRSGSAPHANDIREAVRRMLADEEPLARPYPSSGCNIKWKEGKKPRWWGGPA